MNKITIVSLAWNNLVLTESFLRRLKAYTDIPFDFIFTDNGSTEPIPQLVKDYFPNVDLIVKEKNVGCPRTRNEAMERVKTDITFWLDNDTMVGSNWYLPILNKLEDPTVGVSGPLGCVVNYPWGQPPFTVVESGDCDYFVGYLVGFKTAAYKPINDYNIPVNLDDVELCWGVKENGYRAVVSDPCFAKHLTSQTDRGWEAGDKIQEMWKNWPDKSIFVNYKGGK